MLQSSPLPGNQIPAGYWAWFQWAYRDEAGISIWTAKPIRSVGYMVCRGTGDFEAHVVTGTAYKFCRPIAGNFKTASAAFAACEHHWRTGGASLS